jgi:hypothetical protein
MGASLFGDLDDARPTNHRDASATRQAIHRQQPQQQAWPLSTPTMSRDSGLRAPPPRGSFSQVAPPVSRQQQPPSPGMPPLSSNRFSGFPGSAFWSQQRRQVQPSSSALPPLALQQQQTTYHPDPSSTDLAPLPSGSGIFSGFAPPASKSSFTDLAPLPCEIESASLSSSQVAPATASHTMTMNRHAQSSSDSELHPFPLSLEMQSQDQTPSWQWQSSGNGVTCSGFEAPILDAEVAPRFQIKEEPMDDAPCIELQPEFISLDDEDDGLNALLQSFQSSSEPASFHSLEPTSLLEDSRLQLGGSGSRPRAMGAVEGSDQSWEAMLTPAYDNVSIAKPNLQFALLPSSTDRLELNSSEGPSVWSTADSSGQVWAGMPALAGMFDQMSIGGETMSIGQGWPATPAAGGQYGMFDDNSDRSSSTWPAMPSCASMFDQMSIGGGSMSMGQQVWPEKPEAAMFDFDNPGGSSSTAWASKPWNFSSSSMENSTPVPKLILGGIEKPRLPRRLPSLPALASSMSPKGTCGDFFSVAEMQTINKDKRLKEIVNIDPKRVKRYVYIYSLQQNLSDFEPISFCSVTCTLATVFSHSFLIIFHWVVLVYYFVLWLVRSFCLVSHIGYLIPS